MKKYEIILIALLISMGVYSDNFNKNICMLKEIHGKNVYGFHNIEEEKMKERNIKKIIVPSKIEDYSFAYLEFTGFPTRIEDNTFGAAIGYRVSDGEYSGSDYSFHLMRNPCKEIILAAKANHIFYAMEKSNIFSPYIGFGIIFGVAPEKEKLSKLEQHYADRVENKLEYKKFIDGEIVAGVEYKLNNVTRQFFELTYYAHTEILQLSIGLGF